MTFEQVARSGRNASIDAFELTFMSWGCCRSVLALCFPCGIQYADGRAFVLSDRRYHVASADPFERTFPPAGHDWQLLLMGRIVDVPGFSSRKFL